MSVSNGLRKCRARRMTKQCRPFSGADLAALCATSGTAYTRVGTLDELVSVATDPRADLQVVEARVPR